MKKNDIVKLTIIDTTLEGSGVGKVDGLTVFVKAAVKGDVLEAHVLKVNKNCAFAKIHKILEPSHARIEDDCSAYPKCGGCVFRHIDYKAELEIKENCVKNNLKRIGNCEPIFEEITALESFGYRNKCQYPVSLLNGEVSIGFYSNHSHRVVNCDGCSLQQSEFTKAVKILKEYIKTFDVSVYDSETGKGLIRHLYLRKAVNTGELLVCLVINGKNIPEPNKFIDLCKETFKESLKTVVLNVNTQNSNVILGNNCINIYGDGYITDVLCGVKVRISPLSFYQVNHDVAELLYEKAAEYASVKDKTVIDLYCGAGTIGLSMAKEAKNVIGVEIIPEAVKDAEFNAQQNGFSNCRFICGDATKAAKQLSLEKIESDVVIVDPPRKGCDEQLINAITNDFAPERVVYVSCDSATLARDCKIFEQNGYKAIKCATFDMFPRTSHVESVVLFVK